MKGVKKSDSQLVRESVVKIHKILSKEADKLTEKEREDKKTVEFREKLDSWLEQSKKEVAEAQIIGRTIRIQRELMGATYSSHKDDSRGAGRPRNPSTSKQPAPLSCCPHLQEYKGCVKKGLFLNPEKELRAVNILLDNPSGLYTRSDWSYLYKRWNKIHERINDPSARFSIAGTAPGKLAQGLRKKIKLKEATKNLLNKVEKELENAK